MDHRRLTCRSRPSAAFDTVPGRCHTAGVVAGRGPGGREGPLTTECRAIRRRPIGSLPNRDGSVVGEAGENPALCRNCDADAARLGRRGGARLPTRVASDALRARGGGQPRMTIRCRGPHGVSVNAVVGRTGQDCRAARSPERVFCVFGASWIGTDRSRMGDGCRRGEASKGVTSDGSTARVGTRSGFGDGATRWCRRARAGDGGVAAVAGGRSGTGRGDAGGRNGVIASGLPRVGIGARGGSCLPGRSPGRRWRVPRVRGDE